MAAVKYKGKNPLLTGYLLAVGRSLHRLGMSYDVIWKRCMQWMTAHHIMLTILNSCLAVFTLASMVRQILVSLMLPTLTLPTLLLCFRQPSVPTGLNGKQPSKRN